MDELKKKLLALDPKQKLLIVAGGALLVMLLYLVLPQLSLGDYKSFNGAQCFGGTSAPLIMSLVMLALPLLTAYMTYANRVVNPLWAYITTGLYFLLGLFSSSFLLSLASGWWITFVVAAVWTVACALLKGSEVKM